MPKEKTRLEAGADRANRNMKKLNADMAIITHLSRTHRDLEANEPILSALCVVVRIWNELLNLAKATGNPSVAMDVECILAEEIPVEMGYTKEGWFHLRFPRMLPKKEGGSAQHIRSFLYPACVRYFREAAYTRRFGSCVVIFRHVYDETCPENEARDHDNIELNMVIDTLAIYVMEDDGARKCRHYYFSVPGLYDHTEVYVVPIDDWKAWVDIEDTIPGTGMQIEKDTSFLAENHT